MMTVLYVSLSVIAVMVVFVVLLGILRAGQTRQCPECFDTIPVSALTCPQCLADVTMRQTTDHSAIQQTSNAGNWLLNDDGELSKTVAVGPAQAVSTARWTGHGNPAGSWHVEPEGTCALCGTQLRFAWDVDQLEYLCSVAGGMHDRKHCCDCTMEGSLMQSFEQKFENHLIVKLKVFSGIQGPSYTRPRVKIVAIRPR